MAKQSKVALRTILEVEGHRVELPCGELLVGRSGQCAVRLADPHVSRVHLRLTVGLHEVHAENLSSKNPAMINGHRMRRKTALAHGDEIVLGATKLRINLAPKRTPQDFDEDTITLSEHGIGPVTGEIRGCPGCDAALVEDASFCPHCGHAIRRPLPTGTQELPIIDEG